MSKIKYKKDLMIEDTKPEKRNVYAKDIMILSLTIES